MVIGIALGIGGLLILLVLGLCRTTADADALAKALPTPDDPSLPAVYAGDDLLRRLATHCSDEEISRRLAAIAREYDPAPDPRLYELYLIPKENDR